MQRRSVLAQAQSKLVQAKSELAQANIKLVLAKNKPGHLRGVSMRACPPLTAGWRMAHSALMARANRDQY